MNRTCCNILIVAIALVVAGGALFAADTTPLKPQQPSFRDRYGVLSEHNMFLKDRRKREPTTRERSGDREGSMTRPPPEATFVLTGVVFEDGQYRAYVEDVTNSRIYRLNVGDAVARGHVVEIDIDAIAYATNGQGTWINVGHDLRGQVFNPSSGSSSYTRPGPPSTGSTAAAPVGAPPTPLDPSSANLSIEERMRLRRAQELQK